jgi:hypothetical protein
MELRFKKKRLLRVIVDSSMRNVEAPYRTDLFCQEQSGHNLRGVSIE